MPAAEAAMYNKIFTKILDSSVWLEAAHTRLVWLTLIAAMDEDGYCPFAALGNLAARARVPLKAAQAAVAVLEGPDPQSSNPAHDGRRIERVPGGWLVLNAQEHRNLVTRLVIREQTRERVRKYRAKQRGNAPVTPCSETVTPSEAEAEAEAHTHIRRATRATGVGPSADVRRCWQEFWAHYPRKVAKAAAERAFVALAPSADLAAVILGAVVTQSRQESWQREAGRYVPHAATWLRQRRWEDEVTQIRTGVAHNGQQAGAWRDECDKLHGGQCGNAHFHAAKMDSR